MTEDVVKGKMKFKKTLIWSIINEKEHPKLTEDELKISGTMPLIAKLFPGIIHYSMTGFYQVEKDYLNPALNKLFPDLKGISAEKVKKDEYVEIENAFLPSKGYEHLQDPEWKKKLEKLLI